MTEFKVKIEDTIVEKFGYSNIEKQLQIFANNIILKTAASDVFSELANINLENDEKWNIARESAWNEHKNKFLNNIL